MSSGNSGLTNAARQGCVCHRPKRVIPKNLGQLTLRNHPRSPQCASLGCPKRVPYLRSCGWISYPLATRFSAKEAFSKAIGLGMRMPMTWRLCEIGKLPSGQPVIVLHGGLKDWFEAKGLSAHITVTDESEYAASFCVVETRAPAAAADMAGP